MVAVLHFPDDGAPPLGRYVHCEGEVPAYPQGATLALRCNECGTFAQYMSPLEAVAYCDCTTDPAIAWGLSEDHHFETLELWEAAQ